MPTDMHRFVTNIQQTAEAFRGIAYRVTSTVRMIEEQGARMHSFAASVAKGLEGLREGMHLQNQEFAFLMSELAGRSWYFGMEMTLPNMMRLARCARSGDFESIDVLLMNWHQRHAEAIIKNIAKRFPARRQVLTAAFTAHEAANYPLAIPVFLAQADGIAHDYLSESFFRTRAWKRRLEEFMKEASLTEFSSVMALPLREAGLLRVPTEHIEQTGGVLNRHQILHGLTCDYGTEINSLKCIGLLDYLHSVGEMILAKKQNRKEHACPTSPKS